MCKDYADGDWAESSGFSSLAEVYDQRENMRPSANDETEGFPNRWRYYSSYMSTTTNTALQALSDTQAGASWKSAAAKAVADATCSHKARACQHMPKSCRK